MQYDINQIAAATIVCQLNIICTLQKRVLAGEFQLSTVLSEQCEAMAAISESIHTSNLSGVLMLNDERINAIVARSVLDDMYGGMGSNDNPNS